MAKMAPRLVFCVLVITCCLVATSVSSTDLGDDKLLVKTSTATFRGKRLDIHPLQLPDIHESVAAYTRIPYAEPPVGELRYARPVPKVLRGEFDATRQSTACPQVKHPFFDVDMETSEDCLFLDVFVPEPKPRSAAVMVWIHGGGYHLGAGSIPTSLPTPLAAFSDVIVVTCNYRLGALGFLATGDESIPANIGLLDQRQVFIWVQENIEAFGGDPSRVTIFGESAGSGSINLHLLSTMSAGLFSGAIMQSGALTTTWSHHANMDEAVKITFEFGKAIGCDVSSSEELVTCLRQKPVDEFLAIFSAAQLGTGFYVHPVADGQFILEDPIKMATEGSFNPADVMIGCMQDEGSMSIVPNLLDQEIQARPVFNSSEYRDFIAPILGIQDPVVIDMTAYAFASPEQLGDPNADYAPAIIDVMGDHFMLCPTFTMSEQLAKAGKSVYAYLMTHVPSHSIFGKNYTWLGATHGEDIPYVLGSPFSLLDGAGDNTKMMGQFGNDQEVQLSLQIMQYWSNFAKTGDPNLSSKDEPVSESKSTWPRYTTLEPGYKELSVSLENRRGNANAKRCYYLQELLPALIKNADEIARLKSLLADKVNADSEKSCDDPESCPEN